MSVPTPADSQPEGRGPQPPDFGRPSHTLLERAERGYARFLAVRAPDVHTGDHGQDDNAASTR
ncbi:hypothetical protein LRE75_34465 [Streptomyces sp. 372A]